MYTYVLLALGGIGIGLSHSFPLLWPLVLFSLFPLLRSVYNTHLSRKEAFLRGAVFGTTLMASTLHWFFNTLPLSWLGIHDPLASVVLVFIFWSVLSFVLGLAVGGWVLMARFVATKRAVDVLTFSVLWVLFEYVRMWLFALVAHGKGSLIEPHFSFGFLGYALAHDPWLLQLASFGGVYVLSFIATLLGVSFYFFVRRFDQLAGFSVALAIIALSVLPVPGPSVGDHAEHVTVLETNFSSSLVLSKEEMDYRRDVITEKLRTVAQTKPESEIIVLPEASRYTEAFAGTDTKHFFTELLGERDVLLVDSWRVTTDTGVFNRIVFFSTQRGVLAVQDKRFLLPAGEYMPYLGEFFIRLLGKNDELHAIEMHRTYTASRDLQPVTFNGTTIGALACSGVVSPQLYWSFVEHHGADVLINVSSQAWFHHSVNPFNQLVAMAKVHAVLHNRPYIQASNAAPSFSVSSNGVVGTK